MNVLASAGLTPNPDDLTQLAQSIALLSRIPYVLDVGVQNVIVINPNPAVKVYATPLIFAVRFANTNNGPTLVNVSGLGNLSLTRPSGAQLSANDIVEDGVGIIGFDGAHFQLLSAPGSLSFPSAIQIWHYGSDTSGVANAVQLTIDPVGSELPVGLPFAFVPAHNNTGATVINVNTTGNVPLTRGAGTALSANDINAGTIAIGIFDGAEVQLINPLQLGSNSSGAPADWNDVTGQLQPYWFEVNSASVLSPPSSPAAGDAYIIPLAATGAWSGLGGKIAQWTGAGWVYASYRFGAVIGVSDTLTYYQRIVGGWQQVQVPTLGKLYFYAQLG